MQKKSKHFFSQVYEIVAQIPYGHVLTYGQIAKLIGMPRHARMVGYAMHGIGEDKGLPWHRVVNRRGEPGSERFGRLQRQLLRKEGVTFDEKGRVNMTRHLAMML